MATLTLSKTVTVTIVISDPELSNVLGKATTVVGQAETALGQVATQLGSNADPEIQATMAENDWTIRAT